MPSDNEFTRILQWPGYRVYRQNIDENEILATLDPLFAQYANERTTDEDFGDFLLRAGVLAPEAPRTIPATVIA